MTFEQYKQAIAAAREVEESRRRAARDATSNVLEVEHASDRTYRVGLGVQVTITGGQQLEIKLDPGAAPLDGQAARWIMLSLPSATLRRIADARELHERWIRGELAELPQELP